MGKIYNKIGTKKYEQGQKNSQNVIGCHAQWNVGK